MKTILPGTSIASALALSILSCATAGIGKGGGGSASNDELAARNNALGAFVNETLKPCAHKGKPEDRGVLIVSARPDGSLQMGPMQWLGSEEMKACISEQSKVARMPRWSGPTVTWIWSIGTKEHPAPAPLPEPPRSYGERHREYVMQAQGNTGSGNDASTGPLAACAQRTLPPDAYALVSLRLFVFPDGKVVGATPIGSDGEGRSAEYQECVSEIVREWRFEGFQGPSFTTLDISLKYGVNPLDK